MVVYERRNGKVEEGAGYVVGRTCDVSGFIAAR